MWSCWSKNILLNTSATDAAAVSPNGIKTLLPNGLSTFFITGKPVFSNGPKSQPKNLSNWPILDNCVFDYFILADEPFAKALRNLETCVLVNNSLCEKLFSSLELPITFHERFKVTSVPFFIANFNLLRCELELLYWIILYWYCINKKWNYSILMVPCEKSKMVCLASSIMKNIVVFSGRCKFLVKLICCIAFGSASSASCLLKGIVDLCSRDS